jgi:CheY-like chemotaxis protein
MSIGTSPPSRPSESSRVQDSAASSPVEAVSVLVIDDDEDIREILSEILVRAGYSVVGASNGAEALRVLETVLPCLILLDLNMPIMDGFEFRRRQRLDPALERIPTVVMSALYQMKQRIVGLGVDGALAKPVDLKDVMELVSRYCRVA